MQVKDLDGNIHSWHLTGNMAKGKIDNKSGLHLQARELLAATFPTMQLLEEVPIPLRKSETLYLDFYLPLKKTCVEVHGEQHYKFVQFYHNTMLGYLRSQKRDKAKEEWCNNNGINYIVFPYNESIEEWQKRLTND